MIAKIVKGASFRGALNYVLEKDAAKIIGGNMSGESPRELSAEFSATRKLNNKVRNAVYHVSLALPAGERLTDDTWGKLATRYLYHMGLDPLTHQYTVARHHGTDHDHIHIIASRIDYNGQVFNVYNDRKKSLDVVRQLEKDYGLKQIPSTRAPGKPKIKQGEYDMQRRTGRKSEKVIVSDAIRAILGEEGTMPVRKFCEELEARGIIAIPGIADNGRVQGFSFQNGTRTYSGATVGQGWQYLAPRLEIGPADIQYLQDRKNRMKQGTLTDALRSIRSAVWDVAIHGVGFVGALEKQGWKLDENDNIGKGGRAYHLPDLIDTDRLEKHLKTLESVTEKERQTAREKARELAKGHYADTRRSHSVFSQIPGEDLLGAMILFNSVFPYLLVLMVVAELIRVSADLQGEKAYQAQIREVWGGANRAVQAEIRTLQQEVINHHGRTTKSLAADSVKHVADGGAIQGGGGAVPETSGSGESDNGSVGTKTDRTSGSVQGRSAGNADRERQFAVAQEDPYNNGSDGIFGGNSPVVVESVPARGQQPHVSADTVARAVVGDVSGFLQLAEELSILARGEDMSKVKAKSKSVLYKEQVWDRQHSALQAPAYRVTVRGRGAEDGKTINLCKRKDGTEATWTADEVKAQIPSLEYWNARGYDVYITPMDEDYHHILIDDLTAAGVEHLKASGFSPCLVQVSSANNFQAIIRVPKAETSPEEQSAGNVLLQKLNTLPDGCGGDRAISAPRHPFRMTGFCNKKPSRGNVQTKIELLKPGAVCEKAAAAMEAIREARAADRRRETEERNRFETRTRRHAIETVRDGTIQRPEGETDADKDFRFRWNKFHGLAKKNVREGIWQNVDDSAIDFRVCKEMLASGYDEEETADSLRRCSPKLYDRHNNPDDYVRRTIRAAVRAEDKGQEKDGLFFGGGRG